MEGQTQIISNNGTATATGDVFSQPMFNDEQVASAVARSSSLVIVIVIIISDLCAPITEHLRYFISYREMLNKENIIIYNR